MDRHSLLQRLTAAGAAVMLLAAACTPGETNTTPLSPIGTDSDLGTAVVSSPVPTIEATAGDVSTQNVKPTESDVESTAEGEATAMSTEAATAEGTAMATAETTQMPAMTPEAENMPVVLLSSELVGSTVVDMNAAEVGTVEEILVDDQGAVQFVVIDAEAYLNDRDTDATPEATAEVAATETMAAEGVVAVPPADLTVNAQATDDDDSHVLVYNGTADDLRALGGFDVTLLDQDGFWIDTTDSQVASAITYDGLIRVTKFGDFDLKNAEGDDLGEVEDLIVNVNQGLVTYGVVDFGGFLGIAEQTTAVPWGQFTIDRASDTPGFRLDATNDTLENAPTIDLGSWPNWPERIEGQGDWSMDWDSQIRTFWNGAASQ